jgi:hypothetical protein
MSVEKKLIKIVGKIIPNELIYDINDEIENLKTFKNKKRQEKQIAKILDELDDISSIANDALNDTKSQNKKDKIKIFIEYNDKRIETIKNFKMNININEPKQEKPEPSKKECPDGKILNPKTNRCIKIKEVKEKKQKGRPKKDINEPKPEPKPEPEPSKKECPPDKVLNPKTNRCIKKKPEKDPNEPPKKRGRPKKELIIDINEPKKEEKRTTLERELIKLLPKISPSFFYDIDKVIKEIDESNYSINLKINRIKEIINDLNDISFDVIERKEEATEKKKKDYMRFMEYHNNRKDKANEYHKELLMRYNKIYKKGAGLKDKSHIIQSILFNKSIHKLPEALIYMIKNNYKINKIDETDDYYRFRQVEPNLLKKKGYTDYKTIEKDNGIKEIIAY